MRTIPYSATRDDLYRPFLRGNYFSDNEAQTTAGLCAELSRLAYARKTRTDRAFDQGLVTSVLAGIGFSGCQFFENTETTAGTNCFTATGVAPSFGGRVGLVVFRGTDADDPTDIGDDADLILKSWEQGGKVHSGFFRALFRIEHNLSSTVKAMGCPVLFTGHSLGAALATLAASLYRKSIAPSSALYTFGSPRVGDAAFVATLDGMAGRRYVDCTDVVTELPPESAFYTHVGAPYYINRNGEISFNPSALTIVADHTAGVVEYLEEYAWRHGNVGVRHLADHIPMNYVYAVRAAAEASAAAGA